MPQKLGTESVVNMTSLEELSELVLLTWHMQMTYRQDVPFTASLNRGFLE